MDLDKNVTLN